MSLLTDIFGRHGSKTTVNMMDPAQNGPAHHEIQSYFQALTAYTPSFTTYSGGLYEMELTRSAVHAFAKACSKLSANVDGPAMTQYADILTKRPNAYETPSQFLYRVATCLAVNNTAFIVPIYDAVDRVTVVGLYPVVPETCAVKADENGEPWLEYAFGSGQRAAVKLSAVGILRRHFYKSDIFGETNAPITDTLQLLHTQSEAITNGIKQSATIRFIAKLASALQPETVTRERERFVRDNMGADNTSGVMMFDAKYEDVKQIESRPFVVDPQQMEIINNNVYSYYGVNKAILQNAWENTDAWDAFYKGEVEPFAIQLSEVISRMLCPDGGPEDRVAYGMNRLQYASVSERLTVVTQMFDREMISINEAREIFSLSPVPDGDKRYRRGEYKLNGDDETDGESPIADAVTDNKPPEVENDTKKEE